MSTGEYLHHPHYHLFVKVIFNIIITFCVARSSWEAAQDWSLPVEFCHLHGLPLSWVYPAHCARDGHFLNFLLFVQLHHFTSQQVTQKSLDFLARHFLLLSVHVSTSHLDTVYVLSHHESPSCVARWAPCSSTLAPPSRNTFIWRLVSCSCSLEGLWWALRPPKTSSRCCCGARRRRSRAGNCCRRH